MGKTWDGKVLSNFSLRAQDCSRRTGGLVEGRSRPFPNRLVSLAQGTGTNYNPSPTKTSSTVCTLTRRYQEVLLTRNYFENNFWLNIWDPDRCWRATVYHINVIVIKVITYKCFKHNFPVICPLHLQPLLCLCLCNKAEHSSTLWSRPWCLTIGA